MIENVKARLVLVFGREYTEVGGTVGPRLSWATRHTPFRPTLKTEENLPENVLISITEHEPIPPILEHVQTQQHSVEVAPFVDDDLARFLFPFVAALDAEDVPVLFRSL